MWGDVAMRQCQTVDREECGSELPAQLPFQNFVCLFRGSKLKDPTHPEKNMSGTRWWSYSRNYH